LSELISLRRRIIIPSLSLSFISFPSARATAGDTQGTSGDSLSLSLCNKPAAQRQVGVGAGERAGASTFSAPSNSPAKSQTSAPPLIRPA